MKMWIGNFDGVRDGLVIAPSKERARKVVGGGRADFDGYWRLQDHVDGSLQPEVLYTRPIAKSCRSAWQQGRCPIEKKGGRT